MRPSLRGLEGNIARNRVGTLPGRIRIAARPGGALVKFAEREREGTIARNRVGTLPGRVRTSRDRKEPS